MLSRLRRHAAANVVAYLALFVALGGTAAATTYVVSSNAQIGPHTVYGSVKPSGANDNVTDGSLGTADLADRTVSNRKLGGNAVTTDKVANNTLTGNDIDESKLGPVPDESNVTRIHATLADDGDVEFLPVPADADFGLYAGCFNLGAGGDFRLNAFPADGPNHGTTTLDSGFISSHAWPQDAPNPSNVATESDDITQDGALFFETDQQHSGDEYTGTVVLDDDDQTLTVQLTVDTTASSCRMQGTALLKAGAVSGAFSAARRATAAPRRRTSRSGG